MKSMRGWGSIERIPKDILKAINWDDYMDISTKPYPINLVNTKKNAKAHRKYKLKIKRFLEK